MFKYYICYVHGGYEFVNCYEAIAKDSLILFRNASGQVVLAVPLANVAYLKLHED